MKKTILNILMILLAAFIPVSSYAFAEPDPNYVLHVKITNATNKKLSFDRVSILRTDSEYYVSPTVMNPGETSVITVIKSLTKHNDIEGIVFFLDSYGNEVGFYIRDREQVHIGQPIFSVWKSDKYRSEVIKKPHNPLLNPNPGPRYLSYIAADVNIFEKSEKNS